MTEFEIKQAQAVVDFGQLTGGAKETMMQLFTDGPTWDGNLISKTGRSELVGRGLVQRVKGWQQLTEDGLIMAISVNVKSWSDQRWHRKQQCL